MVRNPDINFNGKCQNDSTSGFLTNVTIRKNVTSFLSGFLTFVVFAGNTPKPPNGVCT